MVKLITILSLLTISSTVFAAEELPPKTVPCQDIILQAAQYEINHEAKTYNIKDLDFGHIKPETLKILSQDKQTSKITVTLKGSIYVELYDIEVTANSQCFIESVVLTDLGER